MVIVEEHEAFSAWLKGLRDPIGRRAIVRRLTKLAATGHFGDAQSVGDGVSEMRFHVGPGYRVYYTEKDGAIVLLLCGGDKGSQQRDIEKAKKLAAEL